MKLSEHQKHRSGTLPIVPGHQSVRNAVGWEQWEIAMKKKTRERRRKQVADVNRIVIEEANRKYLRKLRKRKAAAKKKAASKKEVISRQNVAKNSQPSARRKPRRITKRLTENQEERYEKGISELRKLQEELANLRRLQKEDSPGVNDFDRAAMK